MIGDVDVSTGGAAARAHIGYLPEQVALYPELSVEGQLRFAGEMKGLGGRGLRNAVRDVAERCGVEHVLARPTGVLSKGYRQRVGIAQALLGDPAVLVLDEPTVGLDPVQTVEVREVIKSLGGCTRLVSTHLLGDVAHLCDRVVILREGRLLAEDTPAGLADRVGGGLTVVVRVEGPPAMVGDVIRGIAAEGAEVEEEATGVRCALRGKDARTSQQRVVAAALARGWAIREIREEESTLEDLFVRLVG